MYDIGMMLAQNVGASDSEVEPIPPCHYKFELSQQLVENLLELDEEHNTLIDNQQFIPVIPNDWEEATTCWKDVDPNARYQVRRRKKAQTQPQSERDEQNEVSEYDWVYRLFTRDEVLTEPKVSDRQVKPVKWDAVTALMGVSVWKASVESGTYRYIPNNGVYRAVKFLHETGEWYTVNKNYPEKVSSSWQHKQIRREMKRHESRHHYGRARSTIIEQTPFQGRSSEPCVALSAPALVSSTNDLFVKNVTAKLCVLKEQLKRDPKSFRKNYEEFPSTQIRIPATTTCEIKTVQTENSFSKVSSKTPCEIKAVQTENSFSKVSSKTPCEIKAVQIENDVSKIPARASCDIKSAEIESDFLKRESKHQVETRMKAKSAMEYFSIKQMAKPENLRPLEKLTSHYKQAEDTTCMSKLLISDESSMGKTPDVSGSQGEVIPPKSNLPNDSFISGTKVLGGYRHRLDPDKPNAAQNPDIQNYENISNLKYSVKALNSIVSPPPSSVGKRQRSTTSAKRDLSPRAINDGFFAAPVGRPKDREYRQGSPKISSSRAVLPEIAGKKLEVAVTNHRWL